MALHTSAEVQRSENAQRVGLCSLSMHDHCLCWDVFQSGNWECAKGDGNDNADVWVCH